LFPQKQETSVRQVFQELVFFLGEAAVARRRG